MKSFMRGIVDHKGLLSILAVLVVAIIGLTAGIIIVSNIDTSPVEEKPKNVVYIQTYDEAKAKAEELLKENPNDIDAVKKMYTDIINELSSSEDPDYICHYVVAEAELLKGAGHKEEALDVLLESNVGDLNVNNYDLSKYYRLIIEISHDLGKEDIEQKYTEKHRAEIKEILI